MRVTLGMDEERARILAKSRTARDPERRGIPNGAESRTARNPERRGKPERREFPYDV